MMSSSVKKWLEISLVCHSSICSECSSQFYMLGVNFVCSRENLIIFSAHILKVESNNVWYQ